MEHFDLVIVGSGSGNSIPGPEMDDWKIAMVEAGTFGGTCLNVGCIPSKMLVLPADLVAAVRASSRLGINVELDSVDWPAIRDRVFGRIDAVVADGERYREDLPNSTVIRGEASFVAEKVLAVDGREITADRIVLAAGSRPIVPPMPGIDSVDYHTSDTIMRVDEVPPRLIILGAGYISAELGHVFEAFGAEVTIITRGPTMLTAEDREVRERYTELAHRRFHLHCTAVVDRIEQSGDDIIVEGRSERGPFRAVGDALLAAIGRVPNSDRLDVERGGLTTHPDGRVVVDDTLATAVPGVWAFGDLTNPYQLKHVANAEAKIVAYNLVHPEMPRHMDWSIVPHAVFGSPQVASVGLTEEAAIGADIPVTCGSYPYSGTAYGWALEDTEGFVKLVAHAQTRRLLGAHIIGPHASSLIQQLIQGMRFGRTVDEMAAEQMYIHPAMSEVVENALLEL